MSKVFKNKFFYIISVIFILCIVLFIFLLKDDSIEYTNSITVTNNYVAYIKINPLIKIEYTQSCTELKCNDPIVVNYELVNNDAKDIYKDVDLINTSNNLFNVLDLICKTAEDNNIEFENIEIYSNWNNLNNYINDSNSEEFNWPFIINIRDKENLEEISILLEENKVFYNVEFDTDGGSIINTQTVEKGGLAKLPNVPEKSGYKFIEWQLNGVMYDFNSKIESDIKLIAKWEIIEIVDDNKNDTDSNSSDNNQVIDKENNNNTDEDIPEEGGMGDYFIDYCATDFDSEECLEQHGYLQNGGNYYYDNKEIWSRDYVTLKKCYDKVSCLNQFGFPIYKYSKSDIEAIPVSHKKMIYNTYLKSELESIQSKYDIVVNYNYVQLYENYLVYLNGLLKKYEGYKDQGLMDSDDASVPEDKMDCGNECNNAVCFTGCYSSINSVKGEIDWTETNLEAAKSDMKYATQALNESKELINLFK